MTVNYRVDRKMRNGAWWSWGDFENEAIARSWLEGERIKAPTRSYRIVREETIAEFEGEQRPTEYRTPIRSHD